jgi:hypothetical protein
MMFSPVVMPALPTVGIVMKPMNTDALIKKRRNTGYAILGALVVVATVGTVIITTGPAQTYVPTAVVIANADGVDGFSRQQHQCQYHWCQSQQSAMMGYKLVCLERRPKAAPGAPFR